MQSGWRIGSLFGIPLLLDSSWFFFFLFVLLTFGYGALWQRALMAIALLVSVVLHELGHSLVAKSHGVNVSSITLFLFGGIASMEQESKTPGQAFQVAIAGPMVSFVLFLVLLLVYQVLPLPEAIAVLVTDLAGINLVLALFNMIPGLPLDGGQVLKAAVWKATGSRISGVRWAATMGQLLGWGAIFYSLIAFVTTLNPTTLWIALLGWFVVRNASAYSQVNHLQGVLLSLNAANAINHDYRVVDANLTLHQFMDRYLLLEEAQLPAFYAASDGRYRGLICLDDLGLIERSEWETKTVQAIVQPLSDISAVAETTPLVEVIATLEAKDLRRITVLSPAGAVSGIIDRGDIVRAVGEKMKVPIPDTLIQRIKDDGTYPPELPLHTIAQSALGESDRP